MNRIRLSCEMFYVDVRVSEFNGRFIASADTPDGPSLGTGLNAFRAVQAALEPFDGAVQDLMASMPQGAWELGPGSTAPPDARGST
jgi:hypothetical protein